MIKRSCCRCGKIHTRDYRCAYQRKTDNNREDYKLYNTKAWRQLRLNVLKDYNYICLYSFYVDGVIAKADTVHHIEEINSNKELAYDYNNLIPLEGYNHSQVHELYKKDKLKVQQLLKNILKDYNSNNRTLGKYKDFVSNI